MHNAMEMEGGNLLCRFILSVDRDKCQLNSPTTSLTGENPLLLVGYRLGEEQV